ncbi:hypothetical protein M569_08884 [Genlisea aurea]|uniref:Uncharacterized protein n=1 Tax=Genlisea aurea TaxID=192259 RepID=S8CG61_9LAMI|nr:hypothetical protein M569_08884 [Genlisea aurea]
MAWRGSFSRSFASAARIAGFRSTESTSAARFRHSSPLSSPRGNRRRRLYSFNSSSRRLSELGGALSLMPARGGGGRVACSHLTVNLRAFCELSHGTCQDG